VNVTDLDEGKEAIDSTNNNNEDSSSSPEQQKEGWSRSL
jgi:hypothetical protein